MQRALNGLPGVQAVVTGVGTAADPWLISGVTGITPNDKGLTGGSGFVAAVADGEELLSNTATGGTFTITATVDDTPETTGTLAYNASSSAVQTALNTLAGVQVTVTGAGTGANPWVITGTGVSNLATNDAGLTFQSTQQTEPTGASELFNNASGGTFTISAVVGSTTEVTAALNYNSSAAQELAALDALAGVQAAVSGGGTASNPWIITGTGFSSLSVNDSSVTATINAAPTGAQELFNNATGDTFTISVKVNSNTETTANINYNASASALATALNNLTGVTASVTGSGTSGDPWVISGTGFTVSTVTDTLLTGRRRQEHAHGCALAALQLSTSSTVGRVHDPDDPQLRATSGNPSRGRYRRASAGGAQRHGPDCPGDCNRPGHHRRSISDQRRRSDHDPRSPVRSFRRQQHAGGRAHGSTTALERRDRWHFQAQLDREWHGVDGHARVQRERRRPGDGVSRPDRDRPGDRCRSVALERHRIVPDLH